ncbi:hypothetical protein B0J13DRAFT_576834 [Dactylonectria estremocensis]|uniref:Uncharacterized protein n=1 Tax=Dactylonectria estremocensis TaxID=1079267 RepID=A0A9P9D2U3_9HYPO|nr:hypothetical protein B0J13DRAFT_576834 [Dactylonectria estremocensis]
MKFLLAFLISSLVALVSAVAIDTDLANAKRELDEITTRDNAEVFAITEDNKLVVTVDGSVEGTLVLTEDQDVKIFDADGNEISLDEFLDDDDENNEKRWLPVAVRVLRMLAPVIRRWGSRALKFFRCVGLDARLIGDFCLIVLELPFDGQTSLAVCGWHHLPRQGGQGLCQKIDSQP